MSEEHDNQPLEEDGSVNIATDQVDSMRCEKCDAQIDVSELDAFTNIECPHCGHQAQVPAQLGHFLLLRLLGTGGMGGVFYARDETLGRFVAIKVMLKSLGDDESFVETFKREAQAVAKLNHTNIAQIYSFGQEKGQPYIVMELIKGRHLDKMIDEEDSLSESLVLRVAMEIASGLAAANDIGLIHGDIKPENILLDDKGHSKLVDFGLATFVDQQAQEGIWGTPYYIAPEKVRRHRTDARSDIYSLGATMFHTLTGHPPFEGDTPVDVVKARLDQPAPAVSSQREGVDPDVDRIVARMLEAEPGRRYPTYASLIGDIKKTLDRLGPDKGLGQAVRSKKVMIRKKGAKSSLGSGAGKPSSGKIVVARGTGRMQSSTSVPPVQADDEHGTETEETPKKRSKAPLVILIILLILGLVGGGGYWGIQTAKKRAKQALLAVKQAALNALHDQGTELYEEAAAAMGSFTKIEEDAMAFYKTAAANVLAVEDRELAAPQPPPEPEPEPEPESEPAVAGTNDVAEAGTSNATEEASAPAPEPEPEPVVAEPVLSDSLIMNIGRRVVEACETIMGARAEAGRLIGKASSLNDTLQESENAVEATMLVAEIETLHGRMPRLIGDARKALAKAKDATEETAEIREQEEEKRQQEREAAAQAAREQAEREAAERAAAAEQAKIDAEVERVKMAEAGVAAEVSAYRFADAARSLKLAARDYKTKEGKAAIANAVERYERLESMKQYFISRLSKAPLSFGYVDGSSALDIQTANRVGIRIQTGLIPWREVSPRQMAKFIQSYVREDALSKGVKLRELANQNVNAAIFCALNGWPKPARIYSDTAVALLSTLKDDVERLVPPAP
ncbi:MAG: serine/threonine protein kinase [Kiritimatiellae bacterium]|nr:serine/threonine protein kinase [Kiritimatiellia bacterium]